MALTWQTAARHTLQSLWAMLQQHDFANLTYLLCALVLGYWVCVAIYRVYISPLSRIPGDKFAALTFWYESYYEVCKGGQYFRIIDEMHAKYGPIVRVTPTEVHFEDPDLNDVLYPSASKKKIDKPGWAASRAGTPGSMVATVQHDVHRRRRNALNSFFSGASVRRLEPIIHEHMEKMLARLQTSGKRTEVIEPYHMLKACASDIITLYAFGDSFHFMDQPDFGRPYFQAGETFNSLTHVFGAFPWLLTLALSTPGWLIKLLSPNMTEFVDRKEWWIKKVREIRNSKDIEQAKKTIFGGILESSLPAEDKTDERLANEAQLVVFAGEGTTAYTLTAAIYHLLAEPRILQKVKSELVAVVGTGCQIPSFAQLDKMSYLSAVINEVIRLHPGAMHRQVRVCPNDAIIYMDKARGTRHMVPPGTTYAISPLSSHMNSDIFKDPYKFIPERWIDNPELSKAFMGFSRGTRGCLGITLAKRELGATLASIFVKYDLYHGQNGPTLELYDTIRARDIDAVRDYITPLPAKGSLGLRVRVRA